MKYSVSYTELIRRTLPCGVVIVDADNEKEAREKVFNAVNNGVIILTTDNYVIDSGNADCRKADSYDLEHYPMLESFTN